MGKFQITPSSDELATIIGHEAVVEGKISVKHSIRVDGRLKGDLNSTETVTIGTQGEVEGNIQAKNLIVGGKIQGNITVSGKVTLETTSALQGDLRTAKLVIEEGAIMNGLTSMSEPGIKSVAPGVNVKVTTVGKSEGK
jgi:cytoskeletal protein CcmA (bactofilin family)